MWSAEHDHSKWAVSMADGSTRICFGDLNRHGGKASFVGGNNKRSGGAICFDNRALHDFLSAAVFARRDCPRWRRTADETTVQYLDGTKEAPLANNGQPANIGLTLSVSLLETAAELNLQWLPAHSHHHHKHEHSAHLQQHLAPQFELSEARAESCPSCACPTCEGNDCPLEPGELRIRVIGCHTWYRLGHAGCSSCASCASTTSTRSARSTRSTRSARSTRSTWWIACVPVSL